MSATEETHCPSCTTTTTNHPAKKFKREEEEEEEIPPLPMLLHRKDIWVGNILPFLGIGNYVFVAGVCKDMKELYQTYFSVEEKEGKLPHVYGSTVYGKAVLTVYREALFTNTFYREAFASLSRAKYWDENTKQGRRADRLADDQICKTIAKYGNVPTLEWAHKQRGFTWDECTCMEAAGTGNMKMLKYARENGCPWGKYTCSGAARVGRLDILKYAHDNGCPWDAWTCQKAANAGRLDILQYAHENGCPWDEYICEAAARKGRLDILQYAHENGCPWTEYTCAAAAEAGRLDILKYAHENGCPWDKWTWYAASRSQSDNHEIFAFLRGKGCPESYD